MYLKHTNYYWVDSVRVQFKAEIGTSSFFKVPIAKFIWPNGETIQVSVEPFTNELKFSAPLPFDLIYDNGTWQADLRESI
ncbi:hypothetical protein CPT_Minot_126 [Acinetobacter phage Minot]|nr:hypothetical protein CPT_Minot_126 [Acinetobacter phage Minot]QQO96577.1 hypothetical protein CPT_Mokit_126 [Acinetobacter phage Mokit]QQO96832.1 hypothetical protein CPT_Melin_131 [Acinetobacter phage Melin]